MKKKRGPGRPRLLTLTLEQESARAVRKFSKGRTRPKDNESPGKPNKKKKKTKNQTVVRVIKNPKQEMREVMMKTKRKTQKRMRKGKLMMPRMRTKMWRL